MPPDNWLLGVCIYLALNMVMMLSSDYHIKFSMLLHMLSFVIFLFEVLNLLLYPVINCDRSCCDVSISDRFGR